MNSMELRKEILSYYEAKLSKGALMAINEIKLVKSSSDEELIQIRKQLVA